MSAILAYFDPGSGSLLMQAILGGTAGLVVFGKYLWDAASGRAGSRGCCRDPFQRDLVTSAESSGEIPLNPS
jgi:hypothetical protein